MTITGTEALEAMFSHHRALDEQLKARVAALTRAVAASSAHDQAAADLVAYLASEVLPHAEAEEHTIYEAAARGELAGTVSEMIAEHRGLSTAIERLASAPDGQAAARAAEGIAALFSSHVAKENDILLPALASRDDVDLAALLAQMHRSMEEARKATPAGDSTASDPQATVLSLLLDATAHLARAGEADRACRLAASAWAALHDTRPDLAVKVTTALHRLTRLGSLVLTPAKHDGGSREQPADPDLDVRALAPAQRHETIFAAYHALTPGAGFVLVNDHDPRPLRYQFEAEHSGEFTWEYLETGPKVWRVRIGRDPAAR